jgi:hypothetical protein
MTRIDTALNSAFGVPATEDVLEQLPVVYDEPTQDNDDLDSDISFVRGKLEGILNQGQSAIETLTEIARAEESPRSFEVLNTMLDNMSKISMQFIELHERKAKIVKTRGEVKQSQSPMINNNTTNNIAFVGTSSDLDRMLEERRMKRLKEIDNEQETPTNNSRSNP